MNGIPLAVSPMTPDDLDEIMLLERRCFIDPWTRRMYFNDLTTNEMATYLTLRMANSKWPMADSSQPPSAISYRPSAIGHQPSAISYPPSAIGHQPSAISYPPSAIGHQPSAISYQPSAILAYGGFWLLMDEAHVATIASHPDHRGCGLGAWLMLALLDAAVKRGAVRSTLEVRRNNVSAQRLYAKLGYEIVGTRKRYYRDGEDGFIMTTPPLSDLAMQERLAAARADALVRLKRCFERTIDDGR